MKPAADETQGPQHRHYDADPTHKSHLPIVLFQKETKREAEIAHDAHDDEYPPRPDEVGVEGDGNRNGHKTSKHGKPPFRITLWVIERDVKSVWRVDYVSFIVPFSFESCFAHTNAKTHLSVDSYVGARSRIRTCDRLVKSQLLYQLSYARSVCKIVAFAFILAVLYTVL